VYPRIGGRRDRASSRRASPFAASLSTCVGSRFWPVLRLESDCLDKRGFRRNPKPIQSVLSDHRLFVVHIPQPPPRQLR
jgi:hypothetical protein